MGTVWCKADKSQQRSYGSKGPFNSALSRWTDHVRQVYKRHKSHQRPPRPSRPPQKPTRSPQRMTIGHPRLVEDQSSDGWRSATLVVPGYTSSGAPVPPPRKKRKGHQELARTSYSMDDLDRVDSLDNSVASLTNKSRSENCLDSNILVVTPVIETRAEEKTVERISDREENKDQGKENKKPLVDDKIEEENEDDIDDVDIRDVIIPVEKEILFSSRNIIHSSLGYVDKLSAISEVSTESGFDDKADFGKFSECSGSITSSDSISRDADLNVVTHLLNVNNSANQVDTIDDVKEKTANSKKEWLQGILMHDCEPFYLSKTGLTGSNESTDINMLKDHSETLHADNGKSKRLNSDQTDKSTEIIKTPPSPEQNPNLEHSDNNHSVLLNLLQKHKHSLTDDNSNASTLIPKEESLFLTNTKTNIIYKTLSSDKLNDEYTFSVNDETKEVLDDKNSAILKVDILNKTPITVVPGSASTTPFAASRPQNVGEHSIQTPKLVVSDPGLNNIPENTRPAVVTSFSTDNVKDGHKHITALKLFETPPIFPERTLVNGLEPDATNTDSKSNSNSFIQSSNKLDTKELARNKEGASSSRRSSLSDSLHEFEMSIYDMLNRDRESSEEEDSLKTITPETVRR